MVNNLLIDTIGDLDTYENDQFDEEEAQEIDVNGNVAQQQPEAGGLKVAGGADALDLGEEYEDDGEDAN